MKLAGPESCSWEFGEANTKTGNAPGEVYVGVPSDGGSIPPASTIHKE